MEKQPLMQDLIALEGPKLAMFKKTIDKGVQETFDGTTKKLSAYGLGANDKEIAVLLEEVMKTSGKRIRAYLLAEWFLARGGTPGKQVVDACVLIEAIHAATLVIDDIQDHSGLRRGEATFHTVHGEAVAISVGLQLLYGASQASRTLPNGDRIQRHVVAFINSLAIGQTKDVLWHRDAALNTTQKQFESMCVKKTSKLFILVIRIAEEMAGHSIQQKALKEAIKVVRERVSAAKQYFPDTEKQAEDILETIGVVYQLADDIANITVDLGKEFGEDIRERKITAPVLAAYKSGGPAVRKQLIELYRKRSITESDVKKTIALLVSSGAVKAVQKRVDELLENCCDQLMACNLGKREQDLLSALALMSAKR